MSALFMLLAFASLSGDIWHKQSDFAYAQEGPDKKPDWMKDFEKTINSANTLDLSFASGGYAQKLTSNSSLKKNNTASVASVRKQDFVVATPVKIEIPALKKKLKVSNPKSTKISILDKELKKAVVRYPGTGLLGEKDKNTLIFGHSSHLATSLVRNQMYRAFNGIEKLKRGNRIIITGSDGHRYIYSVQKVKHAPANKSVVRIDTKGHKLTLITCDNFGAKEDRWIVEAVFLKRI